MKTWEMIKALAENPNLKFENGTHVVKISDITGRVVWDRKDGEEPFVIYSHAPGNVDNLHIEWELVLKEVTWQEAIQARLNGEGFYIEYDGHKYVQKNYRRIGVLESDNEKEEILNGFYGEMFKRGKWYIL